VVVAAATAAAAAAAARFPSTYPQMAISKRENLFKWYQQLSFAPCHSGTVTVTMSQIPCAWFVTLL